MYIILFFNLKNIKIYISDILLNNSKFVLYDTFIILISNMLLQNVLKITLPEKKLHFFNLIFNLINFKKQNYKFTKNLVHFFT